MKPLRVASQFKKDLRVVKSRNYRVEKLQAMIDRLRAGEQLSPIDDDHPLKGPWQDYRCCHVQGDWLLIYRITQDEVLLARTGTHSDLFGR
jgi:mRNA interferase YafQ